MEKHQLIGNTVVDVIEFFWRKIGIGPEDIEYDRDDAARQVFRYLGSDVELEKNFKNKAKRHKYIEKVVETTISSALLTAGWTRTNRLSGTIDDPNDTSDIREQLEKQDTTRLALAHGRTEGANVQLALAVILGKVTIKDFAFASARPLPSVEKHFAQGVAALRKKAEQVEGGANGRAKLSEPTAQCSKQPSKHAVTQRSEVL